MVELFPSKYFHNWVSVLDQKKDELIPTFSYGFNHQYNGLFSNFDSEYSIIFDNSSPDTLPSSSIRQNRLNQEQEDFNLDYYLADRHEFDDEENILNYSLIVTNELNDQDRDDLKNLKYKEFLIDESVPIYLGLIDLLYAYAYDQRITQYVIDYIFEQIRFVDSFQRWTMLWIFLEYS